MKNRDLLDLKGGTGEIPNDSIGLEKLTPDLRDKIQNSNLLAKDITVEDTSNKFESTNVEGALLENKEAILAHGIEIAGIKEELNGIKTKAMDIATQIFEL